ncbi:hypothetical protein GDO86_014442 [Hymenochirus boettgeri]|uniref:Uncharacterized protein n=1 Tax=Hymenochirus boettgeri TaxID=247094 RepID=A0A8T2JT11_9PIPI|nr:hypothetical protein GDO86_014442 [Hymenochirus boettgeri]
MEIQNRIFLQAVPGAFCTYTLTMVTTEHSAVGCMDLTWVQFVSVNLNELHAPWLQVSFLPHKTIQSFECCSLGTVNICNWVTVFSLPVDA